MSIHGYTYGTAAVPRSPVTLAQFEEMKTTVLFGEEDAKYLRLSHDIVKDQVEAILDVWSASWDRIRTSSSPSRARPMVSRSATTSRAFASVSVSGSSTRPGPTTTRSGSTTSTKSGSVTTGSRRTRPTGCLHGHRSVSKSVRAHLPRDPHAQAVPGVEVHSAGTTRSVRRLGRSRCLRSRCGATPMWGSDDERDRVWMGFPVAVRLLRALSASLRSRGLFLPVGPAHRRRKAPDSAGRGGDAGASRGLVLRALPIGYFGADIRARPQSAPVGNGAGSRGHASAPPCPAPEHAELALTGVHSRGIDPNRSGRPAARREGRRRGGDALALTLGACVIRCPA